MSYKRNSPQTVVEGGTGASTLTDGGILLGSGTSAITATGQPGSGQLLIGSVGVDPVLATLTAGAGVSIVEGAGSITLSSSGRTVLQLVTSVTSSAITCSTVIPADDTIPQITEGDEILTVTITPAATDNTLFFIYSGTAQVTSGCQAAYAALFQDTTAGALAAVAFGGLSASTSQRGSGTMTYSMAAGTVSSTTFRLRVGPNASNIYMNGAGGSRELGGVMQTRLTVLEIEL